MQMTLTAEEQKAFFLLMGIPGQGVNTTDEASLKKAFRSKAKSSHPDMAVSLGKDPRLMQMRFQELNDAFNILMERIRKDKIDFEASTPVRPSSASGSRHTGNAQSRSSQNRGTQGRSSQERGAQARSSQARNPQGRKAGTAARRASKKSRSADSAGFAADQNQKHSQHSARRKAASSASASASGKKKAKAFGDDLYYSGRTPARNLRFAEYLYYSGSISWTDLVQALVWQYRNRPKLGELATSCGLLCFDDVLEIIRMKKGGELFGEAALRLGFLNGQALDALVREQKRLGMPIGRYFTAEGKMSQEDLYKKLMEMRRHNILFEDQ